MRIQNILLLATFSLLSVLPIDTGVAQSAPAPPAFTPPIRYTITDCGTIDGTGESWPTGINNRGQVIGWNEFYGPEYSHAFLYTDGKMKDLTPNAFFYTYALGINALGEVVGYTVTNPPFSYQAFIYQDGQLVYPTGIYEATAINDPGQITGYRLSDDSSVVFRYVQGHLVFQEVIQVGELGNAINNRGQVVGSGLLFQGEYIDHAFLYSDGRIRDLGTLGAVTNESYATALNDKGQVVGYADIVPYVSTHACLYSRGTIQDLGTLGGAYSFALGINNLGVIVGISYHAGYGPGDDVFFSANTRAFVYIAGQMYDLNELVVANPAGWTLAQAVGINDFGQIAVTGVSSGGFPVHALILTPVKATGRELLK